MGGKQTFAMSGRGLSLCAERDNEISIVGTDHKHVGDRETFVALPLCRLGRDMVEYRRGIARKRKNDLWHWHWDCESYPTKTYAIRKDKPSDDNLCSRCASCAEDAKPRRSAA